MSKPIYNQPLTWLDLTQTLTTVGGNPDWIVLDKQNVNDGIRLSPSYTRVLLFNRETYDRAERPQDVENPVLIFFLQSYSENKQNSSLSLLPILINRI